MTDDIQKYEAVTEKKDRLDKGLWGIISVKQLLTLFENNFDIFMTYYYTIKAFVTSYNIK